MCALLRTAGAVVTKQLTSDVFCVLCIGPHVKSSLVAKADELAVPLVSTEWLIQSLVHQRALRPLAHKRFDWRWDGTTDAAAAAETDV